MLLLNTMQQLQIWPNGSVQRLQHVFQADWSWRRNSTKRKEAAFQWSFCSSVILQWHRWTCWCLSLKSGSPETLYMCNACPCSSLTSGWSDGCWFWSSGPVAEWRCWWRRHCSLWSHQPTRSHLQKAQTDWTDRPEWLLWTGAQSGTEGRQSGQEERAWSLDRHAGQDKHK